MFSPGHGPQSHFDKINENIFFHVLLLGEFNYPRINWETKSTTATSTEDKEFNFLEKLRDCYLMQHITEPTRGRGTNEPSLLDLALTNDDTAISTIETASGLGKSDHSVIKVVLNCTPTYEPISKTVYKYDKGDYTKIEDILNIDWEAEFSNHQGDVQAQWGICMSKLRQAEEQCIPKKRLSQRARKYPVPLDVKTRAKVNLKNRLSKKFLLTKDVQNDQGFCRLRNQIKRLTRKAQKQYEKDIINQIKQNPKKFWQYAQVKMATRMGIPNLIKSEDDKDDLT